MTFSVNDLLLGSLDAPERSAIDPVAEAPLIYSALGAKVAARAEQLLSGNPERIPHPLQGDHGLANALDHLALLQGQIPILSLPAFFSPQQSNHALSACGLRTHNPLSPPDCAPGHRDPPRLPLKTALITFTSGSTGDPKGICLSLEHLMTVAGSVVEAVGQEHAGRHLALLPPGILLETVAGFFSTLLAGGTYVCPPQALAGLADPFRPDFAAMLEGIGEWRITSLILVPEYLAGLVTAMEATGQRLPLLTIVAVGGARTPIRVLERAHALGLPIRQGYGLTECGSVASLEGTGEPLLGSVGVPLPHMQARIAEDGEILLDGPICLGTVDGSPPPVVPFATGDLGRIDPNGRLWIKGRKSNLIVTSYGRNVSPEWVEEALVGQPDILQAMVYGDGERALRALLVPARADADLSAAVTAANALIPDYARVESWREVAPFTPQNGQLTGNGRLQRGAINAAWLTRSPDFYGELEAATFRARLSFLTIPQVSAGLSGAIDLAAYLAYLGQAYHHVRHTVPLMQAARQGLLGRPELIAALDDYIAEETGHDEWILADIAAAGGDPDAVRASAPAPATSAMVDHAYQRIAGGEPIAFFGMVYVLESVSVALASRGASAVAARLELPPEAFTYLTSHGALDQDHLAFFARLMDRILDPSDRAAIVTMANEMFALFGGVFASIPLETALVDA